MVEIQAQGNPKPPAGPAFRPPQPGMPLPDPFKPVRTLLNRFLPGWFENNNELENMMRGQLQQNGGAQLVNPLPNRLIPGVPGQNQQPQMPQGFPAFPDPDEDQ